MLVGIVTRRSDRDIFLNEGWYRVPVKSWPRDGWHPDWIALFETRAVSGVEQRILHYGRVTGSEERTRAELFPHEAITPDENKLYRKLIVEEPLRRSEPILLPRNRRNPFFMTTIDRFMDTGSINELMVGSPLEENMWQALSKHEIPAEREWYVSFGRTRYWLDFAVFCNDSNLDIEVDGDRWHSNPLRAQYDNQRNNALTSRGWRILRFSTRQLRHQMQEVIGDIFRTINDLNGPKGELGGAQRLFPGHEPTRQLSLFEEQAEYDADEEPW